MALDTEDLIKQFSSIRVRVPTPRSKLAQGPLPLASPREILENYRGLISRSILQRLGARAAHGDRSKVLFRLVCSLAESGLAAGEILVVVEGTVWNKFGGDRSRLWSDISRTLDRASSPKATGPTNGRVRASEWSESVDRILAREERDPGWMIEGLWSERAHGILAGSPKVRKSWLAIDIALSVATGTKAFGHFDVPRAMPVLYIQEELSAAELHKRIRWVAISKDLGGQVDITPRGTFMQFPSPIPMYVRSRKQFDLSPGPDLEALQHEIVSREIKLVIFDPLQMMLGVTDENSASSMRPVLLNLQALKELTGCSIMLVHHYAKPAANVTKVGGERMLGSQAFHAWVECGLYLTKSEPYVTHVEREFRNFEPFPDFEIEYVGGREGYAVAVSEETKSKSPEPIAEFELIVAAQPGITLVELAKKCGIVKRTLERRIKSGSTRCELQFGEALKQGGRPPLIVVMKGSPTSDVS